MRGSGVPFVEADTTVVVAPDGRELCVNSGGDAAGKAILFLDGSPNSRHLADPWLEEAQRVGVHLIGYDRPGYGGSTAQPARRVADCATDVRAIADAFGADRLAVWVISAGGPHALACAALLPDLVCAAVSLASPAPYGAPGLDFFHGMGERNVEGIQLRLSDREASRSKCSADREAFLAMTPEEVIESWESLLSPVDLAITTSGLGTFLVSAMMKGLTPGDQGWWDDACALIDEWGFAVDTIEVPVQLWHGFHDRFVPFKHGRWLAEHISGVDAHLSETDGHLTLLNRVPTAPVGCKSHVKTPTQFHQCGERAAPLAGRR